MSETPTPRTDAAKLTTVDDAVYIGFARQLERELNEALNWKNEDPRMLCEQIRVADSAYQMSHDENTKLKRQVAALLEYARHAPTCPMPANKCDCGLKGLMEEMK